MGIELIAIVITGVLTALDLIINCFTACMTGKCHSNCCDCFTFEHNDEEHKTPRFKFTESVIKKLGSDSKSSSRDKSPK